MGDLLSGLAIAFLIQSVDPSLFVQLIVRLRGSLSHSLWDLLSPSLSAQLIVRLILRFKKQSQLLEA